MLRLELLLHNKISLTQKIFHFVSTITGNLLDSNGFHYLVQIPWAHVSSETFPYIITGNCTSVSMPSFVGLYYLILSYLYCFCILHKRNQKLRHFDFRVHYQVSNHFGVSSSWLFKSPLPHFSWFDSYFTSIDHPWFVAIIQLKRWY